MSETIDIRTMQSRLERRKFVTFPWQVYRHDPLWVPPLVSRRIRSVTPAKGRFFRRGDAELYGAFRGGRLVGTVCVAEDRATNAARGARDCMIGFFECVHDQGVADALFHRADLRARERGLRNLYGPFNLDYEDSYGVLVEGRDRPPVLLCGHTPPYYLELFEHAGFCPARGDNIAYRMAPDADHPELRRVSRLAERVRERGNVIVRSANLREWEREVDSVHGLLNAALAHLPDHLPWQREAVEDTLRSFARIADPDLILFAEVKGKCVGWLPGVPNVNEMLIHANGLRYPWDYLRLLPHLRRHPACLAVKSVLVLPEFWRTGVSVLLMDEMARRAREKGYAWIDLSLTSEDNPFTPALADRMGAQIYKRYRVFRRLVR